MYKKRHRYSFLISPIIFLLDSILIFIFTYLLTGKIIDKSFIIFLFIWFFIAYFTRFYHISRNTRPSKVFSVAIYQFVIFNLAIIAFYKLANIPIANKKLVFLLLVFNVFILAFKLLSYVLIKFYRATEKNLRNYLIIGQNSQTREFRNLLSQRKDYGYHFKGCFSHSKTKDSLGNLTQLDSYLKEQNVDVIFCSLQENSDTEIKKIIEIADEHFVAVKFIPDTKEVLKRKLDFEYFDYFPVLSIRKSPLDKPENRLLKRFFDIVFSLFVIVFILSWLYPILWILIKLESKGPAIFVQKRNGINYKAFNCYKFRSMRKNEESDIKQVTKNDHRITRVGNFIRKTSLDEFPQFVNVLIGDMSVVGPRPHMIHENERFRKRVNKFMGRHYVKPGITGLAQVKGYRGEVVHDEDIINRIKYDLFYIENWSFWLDLKIILYTIFNVIKGEKKAY